MGPLNQADTRPIPAQRMAKRQNMVGGIRPDKVQSSPKETQAIAIRKAKRFPPPHAMMMVDPASSPAAKVASATEAIYPSPLK